MSLLFTKPLCRRYRIDEIIRNLFYDLKNGWQRANKGYCDRDLWDVSSWFLRTMPNLLAEFGENQQGYPGTITFEEWESILKEMAFKFTEATDKCSYQNKYDDTFPLGFNFEPVGDHLCKMVDLPMSDDEKENKDLWFEEELKIDEYKNKNFEEGIDLFKKWFWNLWD